MKRFLKRSILFIVSIVLLLIAVEIIVGYIPNSYSYKYNYVKSNGKKIQALAIGHSQLYDGFKPEAFCMSSFNLCNSSQSFRDNYYILRELLHDMPDLKVVIMPIGYMDVDIVGNDSVVTDRICYYHKYMNIDYDDSIPFRYRFECLEPLRSIKKIFSYYVRHSDIVGCDSTGRRNTQFLSKRKHELGYEKLLESYTRSESDYQKLCINNEYFLLQTIKLLTERNISIVMVSPPYYWDCGFKHVNTEQRRFIKDYMAKLCREYPICYLDLETDTTYTYDDFFNETHLSEIGAEKFTKRLSDYVRHNSQLLKL